MDTYAVVAPERGTLMRVPEPRVGADQALVRVVVNGICASDLATWSTPQRQYPIFLGHEPVGEVIEAGPGLSIPVGSMVTGRFGPSLAELVVAAAEDLVVIPDGLDPAHALGEPLGCVVEAFRRTPVRVGDRVAVVGVGFMGLLMLQLLARSPQAALVAIDPRADARAAALHHGADLCLDPSEVPPEFTVDDVEADPSGGFDVVVEATGAQAALSLATTLVRPHGVLCILGYHQGARMVDMRLWNFKALEVVNGHVRDRELLRRSIERGLKLLSAGRVSLANLVTNRLPLSQVDDGFAALRDKPEGFLKAVITVP